MPKVKMSPLLFLASLSLVPHVQSQDKEVLLSLYAKNLGYKDTVKLKEDYEEFSKRVKVGFVPSDYFNICRKTYEQSLCDALREYLQPLTAEKSKPKRDKPKKIPFQTKNLQALQGQPIRTLMRAFPNFNKKKAQEWAKLAQKTATCPKNLNLAIALELEQKAPERADWQTIDQLWESGLSCVEMADPTAEYVFLRAGMSQFARGQYERALGYFNSSLKAETLDEDYRTHYWKHLTLSRLNKTQAAKEEANLIGQQFPLSWYWLNVAHQHNIDPLKALQAKPRIQDIEEAGDPVTNLFLNWIKVASELEPTPTDMRIFFEKVALRVASEKSVALSQYTSRLFHKMQLYRLQILVLSQVVLNDPEKLNQDHLELLFPRPFFENMKQHSGVLDTAVLLGLARQESGFDTFARSSANARGLLQLLHSTAKGLNRKIQHNDLYNYDLNIELGAKYILRLMARYDDSLEHALGAYNAGSTHMSRWRERYLWAKEDQLFIDLIPFRETRDYIPSVLRNAYWYHRLFPSLNDTSSGPVKSGKLLEPLLQKVPTK